MTANRLAGLSEITDLAAMQCGLISALCLAASALWLDVANLLANVSDGDEAEEG
jgi:hypothetical protein